MKLTLVAAIAIVATVLICSLVATAADGTASNVSATSAAPSSSVKPAASDAAASLTTVDKLAAMSQFAEQIKNAKTVTWNTTVYCYAYNGDGHRVLFETNRLEYAFKAPGLYRVALKNKQGDLVHVRIRDVVKDTEMLWVPENGAGGQLTASLSAPEVVEGPFVSVVKEIMGPDLERLGQRKIGDRAANGLRVTHRYVDDDKISTDYWFDTETKRLVRVCAPGTDIFDPDADPGSAVPWKAADASDARVWHGWQHDKSPEGECWTLFCRVDHDIVFNTELDDALFRFPPPGGGKVEVDHRPGFTEFLSRPDESERAMVNYLGILADFNDRTFPDQVTPYAIPPSRMQKVWAKPEKDRTPAEKKLLETDHNYMAFGLHQMPPGRFIEDHSVQNSFRYLGQGVKLDEWKRIVCWYKLTGSTTYRVVYGDLSIRNLAESKLPLPVDAGH